MDLHSSGRFMKDYRHGLDAIEDLHRLADPNLSTVISRVHFHLAEIRRKAELSLDEHPGLIPLKNKIKQDFKFILEEAVMNIENCRQLIISETANNLSLMQLGRLVEVLPKAVRLISRFPISGMLEASYNQKSLLFTVKIENFDELKKIKAEVYKLSREFFELKVLPTFQIEKGNTLIFQFDFSHVDDLSYVVELAEKRVLLSNTFADYALPVEKVNMIGNQTTLIMDAQGEFHYYETLDISKIKESISNGARPALFHFPFLFRPLSIIIPIEGEIAPSYGFFGTGCEKLLTDQDFGKSIRPAQSLDLFAILSK